MKFKFEKPGKLVRNGLLEFIFVLVMICLNGPAVSAASQIDISGPAGSVGFGKFVTVLSNGNFVVADPDFGSSFNGAVYLYNGQTRALISSISGNNGDSLGGGGVFALPNGNYIVSSPNYTSGSISNAGLVSFCNGATG